MNVQHRLKCIHKQYTTFHAAFSGKLSEAGDEMFQIKLSDETVYSIYWDFEALLNAVSSGLDVLARILSTAYKGDILSKFEKLARKDDFGGYSALLQKARSSWVKHLKDYRNCFVHSTSVDTLLSCSCTRYSNGWQVRCKLPINPNTRDIVYFRWSRQCEVLQKAIAIYRHWVALDRRIAIQLERDFRAGIYPVRTENLFAHLSNMQN